MYFISFATVNRIVVFVKEVYTQIVLDSCFDNYRDARKRKALKYMAGALLCQAMHIWKSVSARDFSGMKGLIGLDFC